MDTADKIRLFHELSIPTDSYQPTKSDTEDLPSPGWIKSFETGSVKITTLGGTDDIVPMTAGDVYEVPVKKLWDLEGTIDVSSLRILT